MEGGSTSVSPPVLPAQELNGVASDLAAISLDPVGNSVGSHLLEDAETRVVELPGKIGDGEMLDSERQQEAEIVHPGFTNGDERREGKDRDAEGVYQSFVNGDERPEGKDQEEEEEEEGVRADNVAPIGHCQQDVALIGHYQQDKDLEEEGRNREPWKTSHPPHIPSDSGYGGGEGPSNSTDYISDQKTVHPHANDVDLISNVAPRNEEGRSRQRILAFAAKRYAQAVERNPEDYDALYNWALVLQESADNLGSDDSGSPGKDHLLEEACKKYQEATRLSPTLHEAFYNWAIAIADRAKVRGRTKEAEELWKQACKNYRRAVQLHWNSPQALNNWGLALQELSGIVPVRDKQLIVRTAIKKFRAAIQLQFDFHRAIYNLGTVLYGLAEDTFRSWRQGTTKESAASDLYSQSAVYIAAAHAFKPEYPVYRSALRLVRSMLPLPYLKTGYLLVPPYGGSLAPHSDWRRLWFVLDYEAIYHMEKVEQKSVGQSPSHWMVTTTSDVTSISVDTQSALRVQMSKLTHLSPCSDLSLPPGGGFCIDTVDGQQYFVAETWEAVDQWVDAIRLVYTLFVKGQCGVLSGVLGG